MAVPNFDPADRRSAPLRLRLLSDERLARRAENGDRRALEAISQRYRQDLYRFCLAMTGDPVDAEAALEGTIAKARRGLGTGERRIRLKPWLYRIARSETMDALCGPRGTGTLAPDQHRLLADLERLPQRQRAVFVMRELSGLDFVEIGAAFGIPAATAEHDHHSARKRLGRLDHRRGGIDLAVLSPVPLAAGGGSGLAGTVAALVGEAAGTSAVVKTAATVAVVAATGLSVTERDRLIDPAQPNRQGGQLSRNDPGRHLSPATADDTESAIAVRRSVTTPEMPSHPEMTVLPSISHQAHDLAGPNVSDAAERDDASSGLQAGHRPIEVDEKHLTSEPLEQIDPPLEEPPYETYEAAAGETDHSDAPPGTEAPVDSGAELPSTGPELPPAPPTEPEVEAPVTPPLVPTFGGGSSRRSGDGHRGWHRPRHRR